MNIKLKKNAVLLTIILTSFLGFSQENENNEMDENQKNIIEIKNSLAGFETKLFPNDSIYIIGIKYKITKFDDFYDSEYFSSKFKDNNTLYNYGFSISNSKNKIDYTSEIEKNAKETESEEFKWHIDSTWIEKRIAFKDLFTPTKIISFETISHFQQENWVDSSSEIATIKKDKSKLVQYENWDYWKNKVDENDIGKLNIYLQYDELMIKNKYLQMNPEESKKGFILTNQFDGEDFFGKIDGKFFFKIIDDENYLFLGEEYNKTQDNPNFIFSIVYNPIEVDFKKGEDLKHPGTRFNKLNLGSYTRQNSANVLYSLKDDSSLLKNIISLNYLNNFYGEIKTIKVESENKAKENEDKAKLYKIYGQKHVDLALAGNIVVGMPEGLLPIPLRLWQITSRTNWKNGYRIYCTSILNSSGKLSVYVQNGKVTMVSY